MPRPGGGRGSMTVKPWMRTAQSEQRHPEEPLRSKSRDCQLWTNLPSDVDSRSGQILWAPHVTEGETAPRNAFLAYSYAIANWQGERPERKLVFGRVSWPQSTGTNCGKCFEGRIQYGKADWQLYFRLGLKSSFKPAFTRIVLGFCSSLIVYIAKGELGLSKANIILRFHFSLVLQYLSVFPWFPFNMFRSLLYR